MNKFLLSDMTKGDDNGGMSDSPYPDCSRHQGSTIQLSIVLLKYDVNGREQRNTRHVG